MNPKLIPLRAFQTLAKPFNGRKIFGRKLGEFPLVEFFYEGTRQMLIPKDVISEINGYKLKTNYSMGGIARLIVEQHEYEPLSTKLFSSLCKQGIGDIIDIGANIGYYTMLAAKLVPDDTVYAFEPEAGNFINLCGNRNLNRLTNVKCIPVALSDKVGRAILYTSDKESGEHNIIGSHGLNESNVEAHETAIDTLDNYWYSGTSKPVRGIKIDVEGAEVMVLRGAKRVIESYHPFMLVECWEDGLIQAGNSVEELLDLIHSFGYKIKAIDEFDKLILPATTRFIREYYDKHKFSINLLCEK